MFDFLKPDFLNTSNQKGTAEQSTVFESTHQHSGNTEALIQTVWKDLARLHSIPPGAIACDVVPGPQHSKGSKGSSVWVQLTVMQWSQTLSRHMVALQDLLRTGLDQYEPGVDHSHIKIVWLYAKQCGCPYTDIANPIDWGV